MVSEDKILADKYRKLLHDGALRKKISYRKYHTVKRKRRGKYIDNFLLGTTNWASLGGSA